MTGLFGPRARGLFPTHLSTTRPAVLDEYTEANLNGLFPPMTDPDLRRDDLAGIHQGTVQASGPDPYAHSFVNSEISLSPGFETFSKSNSNPASDGFLHQPGLSQALRRLHELDAKGFGRLSLASSSSAMRLDGMPTLEGSIGRPGDALPANTSRSLDTSSGAGERGRYRSEQRLPGSPAEQLKWTEPAHSRRLHHHDQTSEQSFSSDHVVGLNPSSGATNSRRWQQDLEERARNFSLSPATMNALNEEAAREAKDIVVVGRRRPPAKPAPVRKWPSTRPPPTRPAPIRKSPSARPQVPAGRVAVQLPRSGPGYRTYGEPQKQFGTEQTVSRLRHIGEIWSKQQRTPIQFGRISKRGGGTLGGHTSHKRGIDVDIRPVRADGAALPTTWKDRNYDRRSTLELLRTIRRLYPDTIILFNDPEAIRQGLSKRWSKHDDHVHLRFRR